MKTWAIVTLAALCFVTTASAQQLDEYTESHQSVHLPEVAIDDQGVDLQASIYPGFYRVRSALRDLRWVRNNDSAVVTFWEDSGRQVLATLAELSGIDWVETDFDIHLVRYYPSLGTAKPLIIPLGGIRRGVLTEATPTGAGGKLNLIYHLALRNLAQVDRSQNPLNQALASHPLMQPGPYRRGNLAMLLALVTAQEIIGLDSTYESYQSAFWRSRTPGRRVLEDHLLSDWILTPERPLARWVIDEPPASRLVAATRPPRLTRPRQPGQLRVFIEGLPLKGKLGFSVKATAANYLAIDQIDVFRLGYACGLREGDIIHRIDNHRVRTHKALIEAILAGMAEGGATLEVVRDNQPETIIMREIELPSLEDDEFWEYMDESYLDEDTVTDSSVTSDSTAGE